MTQMKIARIPPSGLRRLTLAFHLTGLFLAASAHAARPFNTDDARIVDRGGCQIETFYKEQLSSSGSEFWFLPACNPFGLELTLGANRIQADDSVVVQAKMLLKPLETNGYGFAASVGSLGGDPYFNGIASVSFFDDRAVVHANLGAIRDREASVTRGTWGLGLEALLFAPRLYGILESYGQRGENPTLHYGLRFWIVPNRFQLDATHGEQSAGSPDGAAAQRFNSVGLRILW
jgi:hypothetical protein